MADIKISDYTPAAALTGAELFEVVQGGVNVKSTATQILEYIQSQSFNNVTRLEIDLTATDIKNLGTGYTILAAQGASTVIEVVTAYFILTAGATPFDVAGNLAFHTDVGITGNLSASTCINAAGDRITMFSTLQQALIQTASLDARNKSLILKTGGANGTVGDGSAKVVVYYRVFDLS
jgi:hypothetical protein